jgi:fructan beta-fructosidase
MSYNPQKVEDEMIRSRLRLVAWFLATILSSLAAALPGPAAAADRPDLVVADFEGNTYGHWTVVGDAFGTGPARGTLPGQMDVTGFLGHGLVNSFVNGDGSTGMLTSPRFLIERPYLNFLIGGGRHEGSTGFELMIAGKVVRSATGPNDRPGGTEQLNWSAWDVRDLMGQTAVLRIVDHETGGWGHINIDQIVQSDRREGVLPATRQINASSRYLHLPVRQDAPVRRVSVRTGERIVREFDIKLAEYQPQFWVFLDLQTLKEKTLVLEAQLPAGSKALDQITVAGNVPGADQLYREPRRPQFHFTSRRGWLNDPNGLVWFEGEYHLFYQHNPYGWDWGNMHWGHAVSRDLVHWTELPIALYPREYGDWCFSGSAVVDRQNTSGFGSASAPPLVAAFTSTGRGECIIFSNDRGRNWTEYDGNPVVRHAGRDPRLLWHEPTKRWVMAVYDETDGARSIAFHSSADLKKWSFESRIDGFFECPELFELAVTSDDARRRLWVLFAADGEYRLGKFDGHRFQPETDKLRLWHGNFYASQTFSDTPDGRRIQVGWGRDVAFPGEAFNQQMTVPCELTLRPTTEGIRLFARPVAELASLRGREHSFDGLSIHGREQALAGPAGNVLEINIEASVGDKGAFTVNVSGSPVVYDSSRKSLACGDITTALAAVEGVVRLRILLDRGSIEIFGNNGRVAISRALGPAGEHPGLSLTVPAASPPVKFPSVRVYELRSAWEN